MQATVVRKPESSPGTQLRLAHRADGQLWAVGDGEERAVRVRRAFPWSEPGRFISLRDATDREFALVAEPASLDPGSRRALEAALAAAGFVFVVTAVHEIEEEVEIRIGASPRARGRAPSRRGSTIGPAPFPAAGC